MLLKRTITCPAVIGNFIIPQGVKYELVERPLKGKRFKFEALQVQHLIDQKVLEVVNDDAVRNKAKELSDAANSILSAHKKNITILQLGELETVAAALVYKAEAIIIDERITRTLIENPQSLKRLMEKRLHLQLTINDKALHKFTEMTRHLTILRSIELATVAYERGLLDKYVTSIPHAKRELIESVLWALKLSGASVMDHEIQEIVKANSQKP